MICALGRENLFSAGVNDAEVSRTSLSRHRVMLLHDKYWLTSVNTPTWMAFLLFRDDSSALEEERLAARRPF